MPPRRGLLERLYREGEMLVYRMKATNEGRPYEALATGLSKKDSSGAWIEEYAWSNVISNGAPISLPPASVDFRQVLSLDPRRVPTIPNLAVVHPMLIRPDYGPSHYLLRPMAGGKNGQSESSWRPRVPGGWNAGLVGRPKLRGPRRRLDRLRYNTRSSRRGSRCGDSPYSPCTSQEAPGKAARGVDARAGRRHPEQLGQRDSKSRQVCRRGWKRDFRCPTDHQPSGRQDPVWDHRESGKGTGTRLPGR